MANEKKPWVPFGTICESRKGNFYLKVKDDVKIIINGEEIDLGSHRAVTLSDPRDKLKFIKDESKRKEREKWLDDNNWLKYEIAIPPVE